MKLISDGVTISILILITMIIICHTMNYLYPKNKFENIPQNTNYNEIYYIKKNSKLCSNINTGDSICSNMISQADVPYDVISSCVDEGASSSSECIGATPTKTSEGSGGGSGAVPTQTSGGGSGAIPTQTSGGGSGAVPTQTSGGGSGDVPTQTSGGGSGAIPTQTSGAAIPTKTSGGGSGGSGSGSGTTPTKINNYLNTLSESELAVLYKVLYENTQREIVMRTLNDISANT
jgi:hypothetical protein